MSDKLPPKILVVESDEIVRTSMCNAIERYSFTVQRAENIAQAERLFEINKPNIVVINSNVNDFSAASTIERFKKYHHEENVPVVMILNSENPKVKLSNTSNVEYLNQPFTPNELLTAIKNLLRASNPIFEDRMIKYKDLSMDLSTYKVYRGTKSLHLGPTEFKIMQLLVRNPKTILSRQQIIDYVWGASQEIEPRTVDVHVNRLRTIIKLDNDHVPFIKTVRSGGYCLNLPGEVD